MSTVGTMWSVFSHRPAQGSQQKLLLNTTGGPRSKLTPAGSFKLPSRDSLTAVCWLTKEIMAVYLKYKPFNAELWHDQHFLLKTCRAPISFLFELACFRASNIKWDCQNELFLVPFLKLNIFWGIFILLLVGLICPPEVNERIRWLGCSVEKLLLSPLKLLVRRITKTVYHTLLKPSLSNVS